METKGQLNPHPHLIGNTSTRVLVLFIAEVLQRMVEGLDAQLSHWLWQTMDGVQPGAVIVQPCPDVSSNTCVSVVCTTQVVTTCLCQLHDDQSTAAKQAPQV
jgi:hypothetical protein